MQGPNPETRLRAEDLAQLFEKVIALPQFFDAPIIDCPGTDIEYFSNEKYQSERYCPEATFCHDLAFYLQVPALTRLDSALGEGFFFSENGGRRLGDICKYSFDLAPYGNHMSSTALIFEMLNRYSAIYADRVYIAIAAAMMGKDVYLLSCSSDRTAGI